MASSASFIKANSQADNILERQQSLRGSVTDTDSFGPLSNVRFAVFALGSSAYPNFCAFGSYVDNLLGELGGERLMKLAHGDEMCGQEQAFYKWAPEVFKIACETFCLDDTDSVFETTSFGQQTISASTIRSIKVKDEENTEKALSRCHNRKVWRCPVLQKRNLHGSGCARTTLFIRLAIEDGLKYKAGDHVGVFACNRGDLVEGIINHLEGTIDPDQPVEIQKLVETHTSTGVNRTWHPYDRLPQCSIRTLLTRFVDITTPPTPVFLQFLASCASNQDEANTLTTLATESSAYEYWRHWKFPHLLEVLEEFPSVRPLPALFLAHLNLLQPRFYSISSSPLVHSNEVHLTVAVVTYRTQDGTGPVHYGICSNYLLDTKVSNDVFMFIRSAPNFHLPIDDGLPLILVGPGTGIAPFRGFWQQRAATMKLKGSHKVGRITLFFGCRLKSLDLYEDEKAEMLKESVFSQAFLALSREPKTSKTYVQDLMKGEAYNLYRQIVHQMGHFYVCGDVTMAEHVYQTLRQILQEQGDMTEHQVETYMRQLRDQNRYHEDIFGITLRTAEVHNRSRETARIRMESQTNP